MGNIIKLFPVTGEENAAGTGAVANSYNIALNVGRTVVCGGKWLVVATGAWRGVGY